MTDIQYFAANYVAFKDNLTEQDKGFLINWIKENSDDNIKSLLMTGDYKYQQEASGQFDKMFPVLLAETSLPSSVISKLDNFTMMKLVRWIELQAKEAKLAGYQAGHHDAWNSAWKYGQGAGKAEGTFQGLAAAVVAALVITVAYKGYKRFLSKAARACKNKGGAEKTSCMNKYKKQATQQRIKELQQGMTACSKTKNPGKCKQKITTKARKLKAQLGAL